MEGEMNVEQFRERCLRPSRKLTDMILLAMLVTLGVLFVGLVMQMALEAILKSAGILDLSDTGSEDSVLSFLEGYFVFFCIWPATLLAIVLYPANRPMLRDILPNRRGNTLTGILLGLLGGFGLNAVCIGISVLLDDVSLEFFAFEPATLALFFAVVFIQSGAEEIITRQFLYEKLRRRYRWPLIAIVGNALFFALLHLPNGGAGVIGIAQCFVVGVLLSLFVYYYHSLWGAIFFHTAWNFTQSILFGCPNSGIVSSYSLFRLTGASSGPFFDPAFGVEGSIGAVLLIVVLLVAIVIYAKAKNLRPQDIWADSDHDEEARRPKHAAA